MVDDLTTRAALFETHELQAKNEHAAIREATSIFEKLSDHDKRRRDEVYIGFAEPLSDDDGGGANLETMTNIVHIQPKTRTF